MAPGKEESKTVPGVLLVTVSSPSPGTTPGAPIATVDCAAGMIGGRNIHFYHEAEQIMRTNLQF